jgi:hypothetical protein
MHPVQTKGKTFRSKSTQLITAKSEIAHDEVPPFEIPGLRELLSGASAHGKRSSR